MADTLLTSNGMRVLQQLRPDLRNAMRSFNQRRFDEGQRTIASVRDTLTAVTSSSADDEALLTDWFVVNKYVDLFSKYGLLWERIVAQKFAASWDALQDALDLLRLIKRFSSLDVPFFEDQLLELEQAYPYKIFASIGAIVSYFECSICGRDMDSDECPHMRGHLYRGVMAYGIAHGSMHFDHIAMVSNPEDKRCVIQFEDTSEKFLIIRSISRLVSSGKIHLLNFSRIDWSKRKQLNPAYVALRRNDRCFCGSGRKFKRCCISKKEIEGDHAEVICAPVEIQDLV